MNSLSSESRGQGSKLGLFLISFLCLSSSTFGLDLPNIENPHFASLRLFNFTPKPIFCCNNTYTFYFRCVGYYGSFQGKTCDAYHECRTGNFPNDSKIDSISFYVDLLRTCPSQLDVLSLQYTVSYTKLNINRVETTNLQSLSAIVAADSGTLMPMV